MYMYIDYIHDLYILDFFQVIFNPDKKDATLYADKFQRSKQFSPTLTKFGGKAEDGWLIISATGLVSREIQAVQSHINQVWWES